MRSCSFCQIVAGDAPAKIYYRDEQATAFQDIHPVAPVHILIVPNKHIASVNDVLPEQETIIGHLFGVARDLAEQVNIHQSGYRIIVNTGANAGQAIFHLHLHLIGGRRMQHPMG